MTWEGICTEVIFKVGFKSGHWQAFLVCAEKFDLYHGPIAQHCRLAQLFTQERKRRRTEKCIKFPCSTHLPAYAARKGGAKSTLSFPSMSRNLAIARIVRAFANVKLGAETAEVLCNMAERPCWPVCGQHCRFNRVRRSTKPQQKGCKVHAVTFIVYLNAQVRGVIMPNLRVLSVCDLPRG